MLANLEFSIIEAINNIRRGNIMTMIAVATITISITIFGLFLLLIINTGNLVGNLGSKIDVVAFVEEDITSQQADTIKDKMQEIAGVSEVKFISRQEAWQDFKENYSSSFNLDEIVNENPLPDTYNIKAYSADLVPKIAKKVSEIENISEVRYSNKLISQITLLINAVRIGGLILVTLLFIATLLIVVNTIRLTVLARKVDIYIMELVGATRSFIRWPFIIEGILIGLIGGLVSIFILKFSYQALISQVQAAMPFLPLVTSQSKLNPIYLILFFVAILVGMLGGYISVSRELAKQ